MYGSSRHTHVLQKTKGGKMPSRVMCLGHVLGERDGLSSSSRPREVSTFWETVAAWQLCSWRFEKQHVARESFTCGTTPKHFWEVVLPLLHSGTCTWLFTCHAYEFLTAAGVWRLVEDGRLALYDKYAEQEHTAANGSKIKWGPCVIADEPPTIVLLRSKEKGGVLKVLSLSNYGVRNWTDLAVQDVIEPWTPERFTEPGPNDDFEAAARCRGVTHFVRRYAAMIQGKDLGSFCNTSGSQALHSWRRRFMDAEVWVHNHAEATALEREAGFCGRVECRKIGKVLGPVYELDVNASYPSLLRTARIPIKLHRVKENPDLKSLAALNYGMAVIARVQLETPEPLYPYRFAAETVWPVGRFVTTLCGPELAVALGKRHVTRCLYAAAYYAAPIFAAWCNELLQLQSEYRAEGWTAGVKVLKSLLVALPGKFGQRRKGWVSFPERRNDMRWEQWLQRDRRSGNVVKWRCLDGLVQAYLDQGEHPESIPSIDSWVRSLGRERLNYLCDRAGWNSVYYIDTDSLWTDVSGFTRLDAAGLIHESEPGKLKIKGKYDAVSFHGIQYYEADGRTVCAGLPLGWQVLPGRKATGKRMQPFGSALLDKKPPEPVIHHATISLQRKYSRGIIGPDGQVLPFKVDEVPPLVVRPS